MSRVKRKKRRGEEGIKEDEGGERNKRRKASEKGGGAMLRETREMKEGFSWGMWEVLKEREERLAGYVTQMRNY